MKSKRQTDLRGRSDDGNAFLPDFSSGGSAVTSSAADAEFFGEEFIGAATAGESQSEAARDEVVDEEDGGPFIVLGEDGSLPEEMEENAMDSEGNSELVHTQTSLRGANWAARGA